MSDKYRKKPIVITAHQYLPNEGHVPEGVETRTKSVPVFDQYDSPWQTYHVVSTRQGDVNIYPGDWIITGPDGERYPCNPDVFAATYEKVED